MSDINKNFTKSCSHVEVDRLMQLFNETPCLKPQAQKVAWVIKF